MAEYGHVNGALIKRMYGCMYFFLGFFVLNRVRVSNPQQLTFTQIMDEYPSPSPWHYVPFYWGSGSDMIQFKSLIKLSCENDACFIDTVNSLVH